MGGLAMAGGAVRKVWDDVKRVLKLSPERLGRLSKFEMIRYLEYWRSMGYPRADLVIAWNIAKGKSPYVLVVGEPMSGKTTTATYLALRFSLKDWDPTQAYYAGGTEEFLEDFIEKKKYAEGAIVIDEGEEDLSKWWSDLVKMMRLIHDLRGLHRQNIFILVAPEITESATKIRRMNGAIMFKCIDLGTARTYIIRRDPADISGQPARRYLLDSRYDVPLPPRQIMERIWEMGRRRKEKILEEEWKRYKEKKALKAMKEEAVVF